VNNVSVAFGEDVKISSDSVGKYIDREYLLDEAEYYGVSGFILLSNEELEQEIQKRKEMFSSITGAQFPIIGFSAHRIATGDKYNEAEVALARTFNDWHSHRGMHGFGFFDYMTGTENGICPNELLSQRELRLVATTIQWLGTPVGKEFLEEAGVIPRSI